MVHKITIIALFMAIPGCAGVALPNPADGRSSSHATSEETVAQEPDWQEYSPEAFRMAQEQGKIILLSVQASWCHWCHVMNDTTYSDAGILTTLRDDYVVIRVDAEARPDIAERYREYQWPATAFLTPNAEQLLAVRGYRGPAQFRRILVEVGRANETGVPITDPQRLATARPDVDGLDALRQLLRGQLDGLYDTENHGWGNRQKYPYAAPVEHALFRTTRGELQWNGRALSTLAGYAQLIDPEWGGMYQYSVRGIWTRPHYEKIAPIQAGAIDAFVQAYQHTGDAQWLQHARDVQRYVSQFLRDEAGGFYSTQDADLRTEDRHMTGERFYQLSTAEREALGVPRVDQTRYANLNGMLIAAYARLYTASGDRDILEQALEATAYLEEHLRRDGTFAHQASEVGSERRYLADQAWMVRAYTVLHEATGDPGFLDRAEALVEVSQRLFHDDEDGGFFGETLNPEAVGIFRERRKPLEDNAIMARALLRLSRIHRGSDLVDIARRTILALGSRSELRRHGRQVGHYLLAVEELLHSYVTVSIVGDYQAPETQALLRAAQSVSDPLRLIVVEAPGESRYPFPGRPAVYLCNDNTCSSPLTSAEELPESIREFITRAEPQVGTSPAGDR